MICVVVMLLGDIEFFFIILGLGFMVGLMYFEILLYLISLLFLINLSGFCGKELVFLI